MYEIVGNLCASTGKSKSIDNTYSNLLSNQLGKLNYLTTWQQNLPNIKNNEKMKNTKL